MGDVGTGGGGTGNSRCTQISTLGTKHTDCEGTARVRRTGEVWELVLGDSSLFRWSTSDMPDPVTAPQLTAGGSVWLNYSRQDGVVCPFCGTFFNSELSLRTKEGGMLLLFAREGNTPKNVSDALLDELFGVGNRKLPNCSSQFHAGCYEVDRTVFDHVLQTTPEQTLTHAKRNSVTTPKGTYDVFWADSQETLTNITNCKDGPGVARDAAFAASLIGP